MAKLKSWILTRPWVRFDISGLQLEKNFDEQTVWDNGYNKNLYIVRKYITKKLIGDIMKRYILTFLFDRSSEGYE